MAEQSGHLLALAEAIGPRTAGSEGEKQAHDYVESVLQARGLEVETQAFDAVRSPALGLALPELLLIVLAVGSRWIPWWWLGVILGVVLAWLLKRDLDTRGGLSTLMPKAESRNVIGRHVPRQRRGETNRVVVLVAHADSPRAGLRYSPGLVRNASLITGVTKFASWLVPILIAAPPCRWRRSSASRRGTSRWCRPRRG
jgi:hypothetical protein